MVTWQGFSIPIQVNIIFCCEFFFLFLIFFSFSDSIMALVVDLSPDPRQDRCFYHVLRELADMMETSSLNSSQTNGHPFFKTEDNKTYQNLLEKKEKNRAKLGAMKIETLKSIDNIGTCYHPYKLISSANNFLITEMLFPSERNDSMQVGTGLPLS